MARIQEEKSSVASKAYMSSRNCFVTMSNPDISSSVFADQNLLSTLDVCPWQILLKETQRHYISGVTTGSMCFDGKPSGN